MFAQTMGPVAGWREAEPQVLDFGGDEETLPEGNQAEYGYEEDALAVGGQHAPESAVAAVCAAMPSVAERAAFWAGIGSPPPNSSARRVSPSAPAPAAAAAAAAANVAGGGRGRGRGAAVPRAAMPPGPAAAASPVLAARRRAAAPRAGGPPACELRPVKAATSPQRSLQPPLALSPGRQSASASGASLSRAAGGYPRGPHDRLTAQDLRAQLEQVRRETQQMRAAEARVKASMRREEGKQTKAERDMEQKEIASWRREQQISLNTHAANNRRQQTAIDLEESRDFQAHKRTTKEAQAAENSQLQHMQYLESKENSGYRVDMRKMEVAERLRAPVEEHLEQFKCVAENAKEERRREEMEQQELRTTADQTEMELKMRQAQQERDSALQTLEFLRSQQHAPVPLGRRLPRGRS